MRNITLATAFFCLPLALAADEVDEYDLDRSPFVHVVMMASTGKGYRDHSASFQLSNSEKKQLSKVQEVWRKRVGEIQKKHGYEERTGVVGSYTLTRKQAEVWEKVRADEILAKRKWLGPKVTEVFTPSQRRLVVQFLFSLRKDTAILEDPILHDALSFSKEQRAKAKTYLDDVREQSKRTFDDFSGGVTTIYDRKAATELKPIFAGVFTDKELTADQRKALKKFSGFKRKASKKEPSE